MWAIIILLLLGVKDLHVTSAKPANSETADIPQHNRHLKDQYTRKKEAGFDKKDIAGDWNDKPCGVVWFLHIMKTGGMSMVSEYKSIASDRGNPWKFVDLWTDAHREAKGGKEVTQFYSPNMSDWIGSPIWRDAMEEMERDRPHLIAHQHTTNAAIGRYLLPQLKEINETMVRKGCRLSLVTLLRDPAQWSKSDILFMNAQRRRYHRTPLSEKNCNVSELVRMWAVDTADYVTDFLVEKSITRMSHLPYDVKKTGEIVSEMHGTPGHQPASPALVNEAINVLSEFDIVGRTEEFDAFLAQVRSLLGVKNEAPTPKTNKTPTGYLELPPDFYEIMCPYLQGDEALYHHFFPGSVTTCDELLTTSAATNNNDAVSKDIKSNQ